MLLISFLVEQYTLTKTTRGRQHVFRLRLLLPPLLKLTVLQKHMRISDAAAAAPVVCLRVTRWRRCFC